MFYSFGYHGDAIGLINKTIRYLTVFTLQSKHLSCMCFYTKEEAYSVRTDTVITAYNGQFIPSEFHSPERQSTLADTRDPVLNIKNIISLSTILVFS